MLKILFAFISTYFFLTIIRFSILLPQLFSETNGYRYDFENKYLDPNERQRELIFSSFGLGNIQFILPIVLFTLLGIFLFGYNQTSLIKLRKLFSKVLIASFTLASVLITIFSIWRT